MKATIVKCDFCKNDICDETGKCIFAVHKRVIDGKDYYFCCEAHADNFEKEVKKKKK
jgi:YHS domain-containing protein